MVVIVIIIDFVLRSKINFLSAIIVNESNEVVIKAPIKHSSVKINVDNLVLILLMIIPLISIIIIFGRL